MVDLKYVCPCEFLEKRLSESLECSLKIAKEKGLNDEQTINIAKIFARLVFQDANKILTDVIYTQQKMLNILCDERELTMYRQYIQDCIDKNYSPDNWNIDNFQEMWDDYFYLLESENE